MSPGEPGVAAQTRDLPPDPQYAARVQASFDRRKAMRLFDARLVTVAPGACTIEPIVADRPDR